MVPSNHMKSEKIIPHNVYPAITTAQMGSQWRGALRTRHAIADLMKSCWYSNVTVMVLVSTKLFIIRYSFPAHLGCWFEQPKCISRVKNEKDICPCQHFSPLLPKQLSLILFLTWSVCLLTTSLKTVILWLQFIFFCGSRFAFDFLKPGWTQWTVSERGFRGLLSL